MSSLRIFSPSEGYQTKEDMYIELRKKEGRVYEISEIKKLPKVSKSNLLAKEWEWREKSKKALTSYLKKKTKGKTILELGCGNGWLANHLSKIKGSLVFGVDLNMFELRQAQDAFPQDNLHFIYGNIFEDILLDKKFDYIVLAASVQYFPDLSALVKLLRNLLKATGEIHILDSNFYETGQIEKAKKRSRDYFSGLGMQGMEQYYHHHSIKEILSLGAVQHNRIAKNRFKEMLFNLFEVKGYHIFPWYILKKTKD